MEQSKFIFEVQSRPCIWNPHAESYMDRLLKRQAWEDVAAKMYHGYDSCSENEKREKVRELQKNWKSLKDYYKRRNLKDDIDEKTKQKKPIVKLLHFLDKVTKFNHHILAQRRLTEQIKKLKNRNLLFKLPDCKISLQKIKDNPPTKPQNTTTINVRCTKHSLENLEQNEEMKFLMSLVQAMQSFSDRQRFEFKLEVMMLIKKIKYQNADNTPIKKLKCEKEETLLKEVKCEKEKDTMIKEIKCEKEEDNLLEIIKCEVEQATLIDKIKRDEKQDPLTQKVKCKKDEDTRIEKVNYEEVMSTSNTAVSQPASIIFYTVPAVCQTFYLLQKIPKIYE